MTVEQRKETLKRWKRAGDDNELESNLRLEKVVASKQLRLVMETEEERKTRLVKIVATTQFRLALEAEDERSSKNGMDWIWI